MTVSFSFAFIFFFFPFMYRYKLVVRVYVTETVCIISQSVIYVNELPSFFYVCENPCCVFDCFRRRCSIARNKEKN